MKRIVSGIKPSGDLTLGNYIGAIKQFAQFQNEYEMFIFIADLHAITVSQDPETLKQRCFEIAALYKACGLAGEHTKIFKQSDIPAHAELGWVFQCFSYFGELNRMTQFKDKSAKSELNGVSTGLFTYPALMAADILLYDADIVPVGQDQLQHLELTRTIAIRFNNKFGETFKVVAPAVNKFGGRIMSLQHPHQKMSKSDEDINGVILLLENPEDARKKIMRSVTDSDNDIRFDKLNKPGISNLIEIYAALCDISIEETVAHFSGYGYGDFKKSVADKVVDLLVKIQNNYQTIIASGEIHRVLSEDAAYVSSIANQKINDVYTKMGLRGN